MKFMILIYIHSEAHKLHDEQTNMRGELSVSEGHSSDIN